jgi:WD repeat-containing protein 68
MEPDSQFRLAIGSYVEQYNNTVQILKTRSLFVDEDATHSEKQQYHQFHHHSQHQQNPQQPNSTIQIYSACEIEHPYPCTKILWSPMAMAAGKSAGGASSYSSNSYGNRDLLATTGDYLRLWSVAEDTTGSTTTNTKQKQQEGSGGGGEADDDEGNDGGEKKGLLIPKREALLINNNRNSEYCSPLTSMDWNEYDPSMIITSSIDTTCTLWDINTQIVKTQVIAHDKEVFDLSFSRGTDIFASVGADGSVRLFDLRSLEHSTIIYETQNLEPLLRLEWNKQDPNYLATFKVDSQYTIILDIRQPCTPVAILGGHAGCVNAVAWAPHSSCHICTAADDSQALIWDISGMSKRPVEDPILAYNAEGEVNNLVWSSSQPDWVSIAFADKLQILRV